MPTTTDILDAQEAANLLRVHVETLRRLARRGDVPAFKMGKDWRFSRGSLVEWSERRAAAPGNAVVLLIDDDEAVGTTIGAMVIAAGYQFLHALDGRRGLELAATHAPTVVLLDLIMPEMNGPEVLRRLWADQPGLPVALVTGHPDSRLVAQAMEQGPITILAKPVRQDQLRQALRALLAQSASV